MIHLSRNKEEKKKETEREFVVNENSHDVKVADKRIVSCRMNPIIKEEVELHVATIRLESEVSVERIEGISCSSSSLGEEEKTS